MVPQFDKSTPNTSIFIDGLKSCMTYTIQIIPTTKTMDGELLHIEEETASMVAAAPDVQVIGVYPERFSISARETTVNNKCATIFARIICLARTPAPISVNLKLSYNSYYFISKAVKNQKISEQLAFHVIA